MTKGKVVVMIHYYLTFFYETASTDFCLSIIVVDWNYSYLRYSYFLINCAGAGLRNRDCVYRFLSLGVVVD